jgi:hypothetical protein
LEYLKWGGHLLMEEQMDRAQLEVSLFSSAIANLCEELNGRADLSKLRCSKDCVRCSKFVHSCIWCWSRGTGHTQCCLACGSMPSVCLRQL